MKRAIVLLGILLAGTLSGNVFGADALYVLGPTDAYNGPLSNGSAPIDTTTSQAMIGTGAWQANGSAASQFYFYYNGGSSTELGLGQLTVGDLSGLSFSTYETAAQAAQAPNWYLIIYTAPYTGGEASWYGNRLILEPYLANNYTPAGDQWVTWSTAPGINQLRVNDSGLSGNLGFYGEPTMADIQSDAITWSAYTSGGSSTPVNYASMNIMGIVLSTGSGWASGFTGLVDNVNIDTTQGNAQFDLEAVPEPTVITMIAGALLLLPFSRQIQRKTRV